MIIFIVSALLMIVVPLLLLVAGFLRQPLPLGDDNRRRENIASARQRLEKLPVVDTIMDDGVRLEYQDEINAQLLADTLPPKEAPATAAPPSRRSVIGGICLCAALLLAAPVIYSVYGAPQLVASVAVAPHGGDLDSVTEQLRQRVAANPQDGEGVVLLAASLMALNRYAEATEYYGRARAIFGDEPRLLIAQLEAAVAGGGARVEVEELLQAAFAAAPQIPFVWWLAGVWARDNGDIKRALSYWRHMQTMLTDPQTLQELSAAIDELEQLHSGEMVAAEKTEDGAPALRVHVSLADALTSLANPGDTVFIFAKASSGPPMPLAVQRVLVSSLPQAVTLDDSMAMMPQLKLSSFESYEVVARISKSGDATAGSGDLLGSVRARRGETLTVVIDRQVP